MMAKRVQLRRGTSAEHAAFTGSLGEVTVDTTDAVLRLHDGITAGGKVIGTPLVRTLASGASVTLDLSAGQTIGILTGLATAPTFTTSNRGAGRIYGLRVRDNGTSRALTWPAGWVWLTAAPTATTANKWMFVTLECLGSADSDIVADWKVQP